MTGLPHGAVAAPWVAESGDVGAKLFNCCRCAPGCGVSESLINAPTWELSNVWSSSRN